MTPRRRRDGEHPPNSDGSREAARPAEVTHHAIPGNATPPPMPPKPLGEAPTPLTIERVAAELSRREYEFQTDDDGDLTGLWDGNRFWFILMGHNHEVLQVRGRWGRELPPEARTAALQAINDWNRDRLWPKVYLRDEGEVAIYTEVSVDFEPGATNAQIADTIACGLVTATQFFNQADVITLGFDDD